MDLVKKYGQTALITGASSGIGKCFAQALAQQGFNLILVARRKELLTEIATGLEAEYSIQTQVISADLSTSSAVDDVMSHLQWPVDFLVNNAGFGSYGHFEQLDLDTELNMVDLNCRHVVELTHKCLPHMIAQKKGGIICLASIVSHVASPYMATYSASKAFNRFFALSLAGELKVHNIDVLALCPGDTVSEFRQQAHFNKKMPTAQRTAQQVVATALNNMGKRHSVIDGLINNISAVLNKYWPEKRVIRFSEKVWRPKSEL